MAALDSEDMSSLYFLLTSLLPPFPQGLCSETVPLGKVILKTQADLWSRACGCQRESRVAAEHLGTQGSLSARHESKQLQNIFKMRSWQGGCAGD
jgi:hypothetical protein